MDNISGLYKIVNKVNGKFYIGSSVNIRDRFYNHKSQLNRNIHDNLYLQRAWNKHGENNFEFVIFKNCEKDILITEEQKELNVHVGKEYYYNLSPSADVSMRGIPRSNEVKRKISLTQKGKPKWTDEQKKQMSINRKGIKHSQETIEKFKLRTHTNETKEKISDASKKQKWSIERCKSVSLGKLKNKKIFTKEERNNISNGVQKAIQEGRYHKNKIPLSEYETIKSLYVSNTMNKRKLAFKYGVNPSSMGKLLKRIGI
jgi:group I intron endonuclease